MLGVFAGFEREMIVVRSMMGLARKAARGEWTGGTPPFGYRYHPERRILLPVPAEAALVQRIFTLYADRRLGSAAISACSTTLSSPPVVGAGGRPNASLVCCATPPTSGSSHSMAAA